MKLSVRVVTVWLMLLVGALAVSPVRGDYWAISCCGYETWSVCTDTTTIAVNSSATYQGSGYGVNAWSVTNELWDGNGKVAETLQGAERYGNDPTNGLTVHCRRDNGCAATGQILDCDGTSPNIYRGKGWGVIVRFFGQDEAFFGYGPWEPTQADCTDPPPGEEEQSP